MPAVRPVHFHRLIRVFEQDGFRFDPQEGYPLVIPTYHSVPVFIILETAVECQYSSQSCGARTHASSVHTRVNALPASPAC